MATKTTKKKEKLSYEDKSKRLEEILERLDNSEIGMDQLATEAKEAGQLIISMRKTLSSTQKELVDVFKDIDQQREELEKEGHGF